MKYSSTTDGYLNEETAEWLDIDEIHFDYDIYDELHDGAGSLVRIGSTLQLATRYKKPSGRVDESCIEERNSVHALCIETSSVA